MHANLTPSYYSHSPTMYPQNSNVAYHPQGFSTIGQQSYAPRSSARGSAKKQKIVEVLIEKPVIVHKYVDVPEEIIIEKPVERYIEQEVYIEKYIEIPVERVVETEVEVVREEVREIVVEKEVEYERVVEVPVEKYVEVPVEYVREVEVKVPVMVDKYLDRTLLKPIETVVMENPVYMERQVFQDRYVDKYVEVPVDKVVERVQERYVNKEYYKEVEVVIPVDKVVERTIERPVDVYVDKVFTKEVEVPVYVDRYVDKPYDVLVEQVRQVPIEVVRENRVTIPVDKYVEVPVERIVEIPIRHETHVEVVYENLVERPVFDAAAVDIPIPVYVDKHVPVDSTIEQPIERVVERAIEVPFGKVIEVPVYQEINVDVFHISEVPTQIVDTQVDVPVGVEKYVEVPSEQIVEKQITIQKVIEKPIIIPKYVDRYVDKIVDVRVEVVVPKCVEVPRTVEHDKIVDLITRVQRINYRQRSQSVPINTILKKNSISGHQKRRFQESSVQLANIVVEQEKLKAELQYLRNKATSTPHLSNPLGGIGASVQENERLRRLVFELEQSLRVKEQERQRLRSSVTGNGELDVTTVTDSSDVPRMMDFIRRIKAENEKLKSVLHKGSFVQNRVQKGSRVVKTDVHRESSVPVKNYGTANLHHSTTTNQVGGLRPSQRGTINYATTSNVVRTSGSHTLLTTTNHAPVVNYSSTSYQPANVRSSGGYYSRTTNPSPFTETTHVIRS
jgi:hypothetical protein